MRIYKGKRVFGGIAVGKILVYKKRCKPEPGEIKDTDAELERYGRARKKALEQLRQLCKSVRRGAGREDAAIFEIHQMLLEDEEFNSTVEDTIREKRVNAEYAVYCAGEGIAEKFAAAEDEVVQARAADLRDISQRVIRILQSSEEGETAGGGEENSGGATELSDMLTGGEPVILIAEELTPSETVQMNRDKVKALVTVRGSLYSHSAILARGMEIPALVGTGLSLTEDLNGKRGIVDGTAGIIYVEPDEELFSKMVVRQREELAQKQLLQELRRKESVTLDGRRIMLCANIGGIRELEAVDRNGGEGIGLFRSEFIFLERDSLPAEEEQFKIYKTVAEAMGERRTVIRTLDIGADKQCSYLGLNREENPALGCRAIRICLTRPELFKTQLRALLRASAYGNLAIMYPMITGVNEVRQIRKIVEQVKSELANEGVPFGNPEQGIMIETPAAVMMSRELAEEVDFFSIGTNDLTQYTLAIDRQNTELDQFYDERHPAVLRMIRMAVENAHRAGIKVGICGELGADRELTEEFLAMGVDELSLSPESILPLRKKVRETDIGRYLSERKARKQ